MRKVGSLLVASALGLIGAFALASPASAATKTEPIPVVSLCNEGWFVNHDEGKNLPEQVEEGILLDGPKLFKRSVNVLLKDAPNNGGFSANVTMGVAPLFKMETDAPYSTINKTAAGKYWSSKINEADLGGQSNPVDTLQDLLDKPLTKVAGEVKPKYLATTKIYTIGVGYANDMGSKAVVKSVKFGRGYWDLRCAPVTATPPTFTDKTCDAGAFILIPRDRNVTYKVNDTIIYQKKDGVKVPAEDINKEYVVTVKANGNRYLKKDSVISWKFKVTQPECTNPTTPPATNPPATVPPVDNGAPTLPRTGVNGPLVGGLGAAIVVIGITAYLLTRRRREDVVTELPE